MKIPTRDMRMILSWIALLLFHQGYALIPVTTVQLGEPVTFTCIYHDSEYSNSRTKWYKQSIGDTLTLMSTLLKGTAIPTFEQGFPPSRFNVNHTTTMSTLTILKTIQEDEAVYHCAVSSWSKDEWRSTYLSLKGNTQSTSRYTVVQWPAVSNLVHPGETVTLQCSVLSDSKKSCPGETSVHWFGVRSHKSHPNIIYTDGNGPDECERKPDARSPPNSCVYHFSKNVSSSDAGTYYCAVATCGEILFGNGTKLDIEGAGSGSVFVSLKDRVILLLLCAVVAISVIVTAILIYIIKNNKCGYCNNEAAVSLQQYLAKRNLKTGEDTWAYSAVVFSVMKADSGGPRGAKAAERERIYAAVKAFGLD